MKDKIMLTLNDSLSGLLGAVGPWVLTLIIIIIGYFVSKLIAGLVRKLLSKTSIDDRLAKLLGQDCDGCEKGVSKFVFYLLMLFVVVFALNSAGKGDAVEPLQNILDQIIGFIPGVIAAAVIGFVGWILATLAKNILEGVLTASKVDERLGLGENKPITSSVGLVAFFGIILLMLPPALDALKMTEISEPIGSMIGDIFDYIPFLFSGLIIFAITYLIATIVQKVLSNILGSIGVDGILQKLGYNGGDLIAGKPLSLILSYIAMATILVTGSAQAIDALQLDFISSLSSGFVDGYFNILVAVIIIFAGVYIANIVGQLIEPKSEFWAKVSRIAILVFLGAVALQKANISSLTNETFQFAITATIIAAAFAAGVGGAIALGLGGRDRAKGFLDNLKE
ncbi:mechanosensitive ion channel [Verrucomicrobiales bacterium BCK34]|nr:mechanosensitive ion channel [Verrucomicrobiales bacterium BCK34]